ncbi:hypothetical protein [Roseateles asaccharophilus]|uniref:hypothetical protein n=1 Tax=Roseateles asaccharophilus TaxID=582607 RepID=UPI00384EE977
MCTAFARQGVQCDFSIYQPKLPLRGDELRETFSESYWEWHRDYPPLVVEVLNVYIETGLFDVNTTLISANVAVDGEVPLELAIKKGNVSLAEALVRHGADLAAFDHDGGLLGFSESFFGCLGDRALQSGAIKATALARLLAAKMALDIDLKAQGSLAMGLDADAGGARRARMGL